MRRHEKYFVYAIASLRERYVYIGHTNDIARRLKEHNSGNTTSNKSRAPFRIIRIEEYSTRNEAVKREKELKKGYNREKLREIAYSGGVAEWSKAAVC